MALEQLCIQSTLMKLRQSLARGCGVDFYYRIVWKFTINK